MWNRATAARGAIPGGSDARSPGRGLLERRGAERSGQEGAGSWQRCPCGVECIVGRQGCGPDGGVPVNEGKRGPAAEGREAGARALGMAATLTWLETAAGTNSKSHHLALKPGFTQILLPY